MTRILVPTDFSGAASNALDYALGLNEKIQGEIIVLHAIDVPMVDGNAAFQEHADQDAVRMLTLLAEKRFKDISQRIGDRRKEVKTSITFSHTVESIMEGINKYNVDFVVMGASGATGSKLNPFGSNTEMVVRRSDVPVVAVPDGVKWDGMNSVVFASDFSREISPASFNSTSIIYDNFSPVNHFLKVITPQSFEKTSVALEKMKDFGEQAGVYFTTMTPYCDFSIVEGVKHYIEQVPVNALIIGTHGTGPFWQLFARSEAEKIIRELNLPIITFKI